MHCGIGNQAHSAQLWTSQAQAPVLPLQGLTRAEVEALRTDATLRGISQGTVLSMIGPDPLPAGVTATADTVTVSGANVTLQGWDFGGRNLVVLSTVATLVLRDCLIYILPGRDLSVSRLIDIYPEADTTIETCSIFGRGWFGAAEPYNGIVQRFSGSGLSIVAGTLTIRGCEFFGFGGDFVKSAGGGEISGNYFDVTTNADQGTLPWDTGTTYSTDEMVFSSDERYLYASLGEANTGNALPTGKTDNAHWRNVDPHADTINPYIAAAPMMIEGNYILRDPRTAVLGPDNRAVGKTNGVRANRSGAAAGCLHNQITVRHNIISASWPVNNSAPLSASAPNGIDLIEDIFTDNWLGATDGGLIMDPEGAGNTVSGNVSDYVPTTSPTAPPAIVPVSPGPPAVDGQALKSAVSDAHLTGPTMPGGLTGFTLRMDVQIAAGSVNSFKLVEHTGTRLLVSLDTRATKRGLSFSLEDGARQDVFLNAGSAAAGDVPVERGDLVVTFSQDRGDGMAEVTSYWNGVQQQTFTAPAGAVPTMPTDRPLAILNGSGADVTIHAVEVFHAHTSDGTTTGLSAVHTVSGPPANWNMPGTGLTKAGVLPFT